MPAKLLLLLSALVISVSAQQTPAASKPKRAAHSASAVAATPSRSSDTAHLPSEDDVNGFLQQTFGYDPQVTWKIASIKPSSAEGLAEVNVLMSSPQGQAAQKFFVSEDGKHAVVGEIIPFGKHPFEEARQQLQTQASGPSRGPANAPVLLVEFSDLQCPHCKEANPTIERLLNENSNVRFVFQSFPLPSHNWAEKAAAYADCVARSSSSNSKDAFWKFIDSVYAAQSDITAENADQKLTDLATQSGLKGPEVAACAATPDAQSRVQASINLGQSLDVNSTPTLFINGRPVGIGPNNYDVLKKLVDFAATEK
jgi:protein-disulfide isomerase